MDAPTASLSAHEVAQCLKPAKTLCEQEFFSPDRALRQASIDCMSCEAERVLADG
jgi:hypothetical protein